MGLRNMFREMDADKNGVISIAELNAALNTKGLPEAQAKVSGQKRNLNAFRT